MPACAPITHPGEDTGSPSAPSHSEPCLKPPSLCMAGPHWEHRSSPALPNPACLGEVPKPSPRVPVGCDACIAHAREESSHTGTPWLPAPAPPWPSYSWQGPPTASSSQLGESPGLSLPLHALPVGTVPQQPLLPYPSPCFPPESAVQFKSTAACPDWCEPGPAVTEQAN